MNINSSSKNLLIFRFLSLFFAGVERIHALSWLQYKAKQREGKCPLSVVREATDDMRKEAAQENAEKKKKTMSKKAAKERRKLATENVAPGVDVTWEVTANGQYGESEFDEQGVERSPVGNKDDSEEFLSDEEWEKRYGPDPGNPVIESKKK